MGKKKKQETWRKIKRNSLFWMQTVFLSHSKLLTQDSINSASNCLDYRTYYIIVFSPSLFWEYFNFERTSVSCVIHSQEFIFIYVQNTNAIIVLWFRFCGFPLPLFLFIIFSYFPRITGKCLFWYMLKMDLAKLMFSGLLNRKTPWKLLGICSLKVIMDISLMKESLMRKNILRCNVVRCSAYKQGSRANV